MNTTMTSTAQPAIVNAKADTRSVTIALNQLFLSPGNVRKVEPSGIAEGLPVRFARKPATSTKSYTGRVVLVGIASGFRSVG